MAVGAQALRRACAFGLFILTHAGCMPTIRELPEAPPASGTTGGTVARTQLSHQWSYGAGDLGPQDWAGLPESLCGAPEQSPVDVPLDVLSGRAGSPNEHAASESFRFEGTELPLVASNDRRLLTLAGTSAVRLNVGADSASLKEVRFHLPAEHRLGGIVPDAELEFVFEGASRRFIVSVLFRQGAPSSELETLLAVLPETGGYEARALPARLPLAGLFQGGDLLVYEGSMSTPSCAPATRLIVARVAELSSAQLERLFRGAPRPSARPVAELGSRQVRLAPLSFVPSASPSSEQPSSPQSSP